MQFSPQDVPGFIPPRSRVVPKSEVSLFVLIMTKFSLFVAR